MKNLTAVFLFAFFLSSLTSCQKEIEDVSITDPVDSTDTPSRLDLLRDSVYLYSEEVYFWNSLLPTYAQFNPRQYTGDDELSTAQNVMSAIRALQPLDRYSFVTTKEGSDGLQTGASKDLGFFIEPASVDEADPVDSDSIHWFVSYVYDQSTAGQAGIKRGWYISKINGTSIGYDDPSIDILNEVFFGTTESASFEFTKPDGSTATANLSKTSFTANSVLHHSVISAGGKKVGYFVFNQFFGQTSRNELAEVFTDFQSAGINELVVDLRYNPGGATATQDTLANLIAPLSANSQKMYTYQFNDSLQANNFPLLKNKFGWGNGSFSQANNTVNFEKAGNLNLSRVFVIVGSGSASASELLVNNLKPYMDVKLIGDTTYGKPVGFFGIDIFDYSIYPISFRTINSAGNADYYDGFAPDKLSPDGVNKDWGDVEEPCLYYALKYITTGSFRLRNTLDDNKVARQMKTQQLFKPVMQNLGKNKFSGMFIERK
ncbi:S41 family peptidase [Foetidibacter luteolus]|uniref:S41 family peptidase n=1 Tax=Foetidibacter luteolus TaxID=2608880 RepID=UPI00129B7FCB|nr:S41 family peptidase [Foetidibacter luteolus]